MDATFKEYNVFKSDDATDDGIILRKRPVYRSIKRIGDIMISLFGLVFLSPVFVVISIMIVLDDGLPVIFKQDRSGLNETPFKMYKFRSMVKNAEALHDTLLDKNELDGPAFKIKDDPRLTKIGKYLRRTSIDELPQLINVLKGEMSIVGPRPLPVYETEQCTPEQKRRLSVKPGLTCYWQISGRNDIPFDEWMALDMKYIKEAGVITDTKIIIRTISTVIRMIGAY